MQTDSKERMLSVIVPAFNEEANIEKCYSTITEILRSEHIPHELVFVDDGSKDSTWDKIRALSRENSNVSGIHFSRNFGKESAIYAGLSRGRDSGCCVVIDCDLQHPPRKIPEMYRLWCSGYEVVEGVKKDRGSEGMINRYGAKLFYNYMSSATGIDFRHASDFKLLDRKAVLALLNMREKNAFFRALSSWIGFRTAKVEFDVAEREAGESKWSLKSLIKYAISNMASFSVAPMQIITVLGVAVLLCSVVLGINSLIQKFTGTALEGFTTVILLQLFSSSLIMISIGIIGYYISKIYEEVKGRPRYIISESCESSGNDHETV